MASSNAKEIKTMKLYSHIDRVNKELQELGYKHGDPLKVEDVNKFDQMHYYGSKAVNEAIDMLGVSSSHKILDVGSGLGGPARHLAHTTNCSVTCLELQEDLHSEGQDLTRRCNLQEKVTHISGDFLKMDLGDGSYDFIVSWLVFLHIPDKKSIFERCFHNLKPGGKIFIEDFYQKSGVDLTEDDLRVYEQDLYMSNLAEKDAYISQVKAAGFTDVQFDDLTEAYLSFVSNRHQEFCKQKERHVRVIGKDAFDSLEYFYSKVLCVFTKGITGGCRVIATKPVL